MAQDLVWYGDEVYNIVEAAAVDGLTEWAITTETAVKGSLHPGRGVLTGTYRRSVHAASPDYNFGSDNVTPSANSPDRSGKGGGAKRKGDTVSIAIGSGMAYAGRLEDMYSPVIGGFERTKGSLLGILRKHAIRNGLKPG